MPETIMTISPDETTLDIAAGDILVLRDNGQWADRRATGSKRHRTIRKNLHTMRRKVFPMPYKISIHSRGEIEAMARPSGPFCVISITDSPADPADLRGLSRSTGVLRLAFPEDGFTPGHARGIWEFVKEQDGRALPGGGQTYLVHCVAGRVRSASVVCGLARFRGGGAGEVERIFEERDPRDDIYDTLCRAYAAVFPPAEEAAL